MELASGPGSGLTSPHFSSWFFALLFRRGYTKLSEPPLGPDGDGGALLGPSPLRPPAAASPLSPGGWGRGGVGGGGSGFAVNTHMNS